MRNFSLSFIVLALLMLASCNENSTFPNQSTKVDVVWSSNTIQFQSNEVIETDSLYSYILFGKENTKAQNLKIGNIVFIYGKALKKIKKVENQAGGIYIQTEDCKLNEAITDGEISWSQNIDWSSAQYYLVQSNNKKDAIQVGEKDEIELSFPLGTLKGKIKLTKKGTRLDALCEIVEEINKGTKVKYGFEGYAQNIKTEGKIKYEKSQLKEFNSTQKNIEGEVTVQLVATGSLNEMLGGVELPFVLVKVPIVVAGFPMFLNVKILFVINTKTASIDASAYIKTKFKFNSETGISYNGTDYGVQASAGPYKYDFIKDSNWVASSVAAGLNFGLTFPRFELELFGKSLVPYAHTAFLIGGSYTTGTKPCLTVDCSFIGAIGAKLDFLGALKISYSKTLWQYDQNIKKAGQCN